MRSINSVLGKIGRGNGSTPGPDIDPGVFDALDVVTPSISAAIGSLVKLTISDYGPPPVISLATESTINKDDVYVFGFVKSITEGVTANSAKVAVDGIHVLPESYESDYNTWPIGQWLGSDDNGKVVPVSQRIDSVLQYTGEGYIRFIEHSTETVRFYAEETSHTRTSGQIVIFDPNVGTWEYPTTSTFADYYLRGVVENIETNAFTVVVSGPCKISTVPDMPMTGYGCDPTDPKTAVFINQAGLTPSNANTLKAIVFWHEAEGYINVLPPYQSWGHNHQLLSAADFVAADNLFDYYGGNAHIIVRGDGRAYLAENCLNADMDIGTDMGDLWVYEGSEWVLADNNTIEPYDVISYYNKNDTDPISGARGCIMGWGSYTTGSPAGTLLYLSPTVPGAFTATKPATKARPVAVIGPANTSGSSVGRRIWMMGALPPPQIRVEDLSDVSIDARVNDTIIAWNDENGIYYHTTVDELAFKTEVGPSAFVSVSAAVTGATWLSANTSSRVLTVNANDEIEWNQITTAMISNGAVGTAQISGGAVTADKIADNAITNDKIAANSVGTENIIDGCITTAKISGGAVTDAKLSDTGVAAGSYGAGTLVPQFTVNAQGRITTIANFTPEISGDVTGDLNTSVVEAIQGHPVSATPPVIRDFLVSNGTNWIPGQVLTSRGDLLARNSTQTFALSAGSSQQVLHVDTAGDTTWKTLIANRGGLLTRNATVLTEVAPGTTGQVLTSNGASSEPTFQTPAGGGFMGPPPASGTVKTIYDTAISGTHTFTKTYFLAVIIGAGGGGGAGTRPSAGSYNLIRGGTGGGQGEKIYAWGIAPASLSYTVGAGGIGGVAGGTVNGSSGTSSVLGSMTARPGLLGYGTTTDAFRGGAGGGDLTETYNGTVDTLENIMMLRISGAHGQLAVVGRIGVNGSGNVTSTVIFGGPGGGQGTSSILRNGDGGNGGSADNLVGNNGSDGKDGVIVIEEWD